MRKQAFEEIYSQHKWGGVSKSGPGSDPHATKEYVKFINNFLQDNINIKSIVEIGCGDWATTRLLKFPTDYSYLGYDIVSSVIEENTRQFGGKKTRFICADFMSSEIETGDLILIKDVLQHLSNDVVNTFINNILPKYKVAIITNDVKKYRQKLFFGIPLIKRKYQTPNLDILDGKSRPLEIDKSPFMLDIARKFRYKNIFQQGNELAVFIKEVCVWYNK